MTVAHSRDTHISPNKLQYIASYRSYSLYRIDHLSTGIEYPGMVWYLSFIANDEILIRFEDT